MLQPPQRGFARTTNELYFGEPGVDTLLVGGPYKASRAADTPSRRRILVCQPAGARAAKDKDEDACAKRILSTLARRAYRRPVTDADVQHAARLLQGRTRRRRLRAGHSARPASASCRRRRSCSASSASRAERGPAPYRISDLELASRLSFFLWSSIPDDELLDLAERGKLAEPAVLERQVRRMLRDGRSHALVDNFAGAVARAADVWPASMPDADVFPDFDENLREAFQQETELFVESQLREDRSVVDLLSANYTFVNERLARHYGIPDVYGSRFRRVDVRRRRARRPARARRAS